MGIIPNLYFSSFAKVVLVKILEVDSPGTSHITVVHLKRSEHKRSSAGMDKGLIAAAISAIRCHGAFCLN